MKKHSAIAIFFCGAALSFGAYGQFGNIVVDGAGIEVDGTTLSSEGIETDGASVTRDRVLVPEDSDGESADSSVEVESGAGSISIEGD